MITENESRQDLKKPGMYRSKTAPTNAKLIAKRLNGSDHYQGLGYGIDQLLSARVAKSNAFRFDSVLKYQQISKETNQVLNEIEIEIVGGNCSFGETLFNILNYNVGSCLLAIPFTWGLCGYVECLICLSLCLLTWMTSLLMDEMLAKIDEINSESKQAMNMSNQEYVCNVCVKNYTGMCAIYM